MHVTAKTDIGLVREENQDMVCFERLDDNAILVILCDGMGGMNAGGEASKVATEEIRKRIKNSYRENADENSVRNLMLSAINGANIVVYHKSTDDINKTGMGTTCVCGIVRNNMAYIANVGDSRAYLIHQGKISQITTDHTVVKMLMDQGKINEAEAKVHPQKNVITRAVGIDEQIDIDYYEIDIKKDSMILFCSDGLSNYCNEQMIVDTLKAYEPDEAVKKLIEISENNGSKDNITVAIASN